MTLRPALAFTSILTLSSLVLAAGPGDPFAGTWEARVATGSDSYTLRLACKSQSECELQRSDTTQAGKPSADTMPFSGTRPLPSVEPMKAALRYALEHSGDTGGNSEFAAIQKLLAASVGPKTEIDACLGLDARQPDFFVACTVRGATNKRPVLLFFGSLIGLCGQGFCKHVVYPLVKAER